MKERDEMNFGTYGIFCFTWSLYKALFEQEVRDIELSNLERVEYS